MLSIPANMLYQKIFFAAGVSEPSGNCPEGYESIAQDLDGRGKEYAQPHPDPKRSLKQCADICNDRKGCTSFKYANGKQEHGACCTYTGADSNIKEDKNKKGWISCVKGDE